MGGGSEQLRTASDAGVRDAVLCCRKGGRGWITKANRCGVLWKTLVEEAVLLVSLNVKQGSDTRYLFGMVDIRVTQ